MKLSWVEFNWNVPYIRPDTGKADYKRTFRAPEHDLEIDYVRGLIRIDRRELGIAGAVWETDPWIPPLTMPVETRTREEMKELYGGDLPGQPVGPARGSRKKR